jgi:hypothetical protein
VRVAGQVRGFVDGPRDLGVAGAGLEALIARQRDFFAARGEAVEWKTRGHDVPADLPQRLLIAGFVPEEQETVLVGVAADMAADPVLPAGVTLRPVTAEADVRAIAAMESEVWDEDWHWLADELIERLKPARDDLAIFAFNPGTDFAGLWARVPRDHDHHALRLDTARRRLTEK